MYASYEDGLTTLILSPGELSALTDVCAYCQTRGLVREGSLADEVSTRVADAYFDQPPDVILDEMLRQPCNVPGHEHPELAVGSDEWVKLRAEVADELASVTAIWRKSQQERGLL